MSSISTQPVDYLAGAFEWFEFHYHPTVDTINCVMPTHIPSDSKHCGKTCGNLVEILPLAAQRDVLREVGGEPNLSFGRNWTQDYHPQSSWPRTVPPTPPLKQPSWKPVTLCHSHVHYVWCLTNGGIGIEAVVEHSKREPVLKQLDWVAPSFTFAENASDFDIPIPPPTSISERYLPPVASEQLQATIERLQREKRVDALLRIIPVTPQPLRSVPSFPFAPKPKSAPSKKPLIRNDKRRLGRSYLCPHCFEYIVVDYRTLQEGLPLWKVPLWNVPTLKVLLYELLGASPMWKQVIGPRVVQSVVGEGGNYATIGCNLGETECLLPVIKKVGGVFHRLNHECTVGCLIGETKSKRPVVVKIKAKAVTA